ncbi:hypothetical protein [Salinimicrobium sp. HB62]|nr:hypothetical protein [Salinimicrobium sp. HB62]
MEIYKRVGKRYLNNYRNYINRDSRLLKAQLLFGLLGMAGIILYYLILSQ